MLRRLLILGALVLALAGCSGSRACDSPGGSAACTRVLFVGNSYTYVNDLPAMFAKLARSGGHDVQTGMVAAGGETLALHASSGDAAAQLDSSRWGVVVLQEQSEIPSVAALRAGQMDPAARELVGLVRAAGAEPLFFLTWAHRDGWPESGVLRDYASMQAALDDGYLAVAGEEHAAVAPVGYAWWTLLHTTPTAALWQEDGSHPTVEGTYLAACVFYAAIFKQSPEGLGYRAGLPKAETAAVQTAAAQVVLVDPARWVR
jgi:hypothetical protein